ncbi:PEP-CTERM sorting domain-containing protein [Methylicorpusculum oleiharenae]|uniref:PEP-CTERM sorting domain-containing protein n=1 Tax=Methylicorpusculum oleiharenae TaxID=1338687 RepID=UPI0013583162|nr:PEP-CTERM sorting domain-containing protein [Methylicorpusculum oleiharenae]MCD2448879.1 PEP-CTERM sorting domain-containing protein [Methylicorpusculum oleiharenae]
MEITNPQGGFNLPRSAISDLGITISGASIGNGTFGLSDFNSIWFYSPSRLDFGTELIGQSLSNGCLFGVLYCDTGIPGDDIGNFTLDGATPADPTAFYWFDLTTAGGDGDSIGVVSIKPVPLPSSLTLFGLGLAGMRLIRTKKIRDLKMAYK